MADTTYKRLDKDQVIFLVQYLFTKLKNSPLADNTTYSKVSEFENDVGYLTEHQDISGKVDKTQYNIDLGNANQALKEMQTSIVNVASNFNEYSTTEQTKTLISNALKDITGISLKVVTELPTKGENGVIYLVAHTHGTKDAYDEYLWTGSAFEKIGNTDVDLSGYLKTSDMSILTNEEITTIVDNAYNTIFK